MDAEVTSVGTRLNQTGMVGYKTYICTYNTLRRVKGWVWKGSHGLRFSGGGRRDKDHEYSVKSNGSGGI